MNRASNVGGGNGNLDSPRELEMAAYDRLPLAVRQFIDDMTLHLSAVTIEHRFVHIHKSCFEAWISEAELLFPRFRDSATAEAWGSKDHPSIGGPILESDHAKPDVSRRRARAGLAGSPAGR